MLAKLFIQNYAIIDEIEIRFHQGLNIITGETGAGKSILVGALSLILGNRADSNVLRQTDRKCIVEGTFAHTHPPVGIFLKENDLDADAELVIRREIAVSGKSRGFVNDTPVSLAQLRELASLLVDLHQQFDTLQVGDTDFQRTVLDAVAGNELLLTGYQKEFAAWQKANRQLQQLLAQKAAQTQELDYLQFQYDELNEAAFADNELESLDAELLALTHAEEIKSALNEAGHIISEGEQPIASILKQLANKLAAFAKINPAITQLSERLLSAQIEIADIGAEALDIADSTNLDAERLEWINERLALGYKLQKKHHAATTAELLAIQKGLEQKLNAFSTLEEKENVLENAVAQYLQSAAAIAAKITAARQSKIGMTEKEINQLLAQVGMPNARLQILLEPAKELQAHGQDQVEFLFDANNSNRFEPVRKVASGGELSRLMLCIKSLVARSVQLPTLIFDEIDTGISGEAARQVGNIMKLLAQNIQVISITHQPQIAGKADAHFFVYKQARHDGSIATGIKLLSDTERINAIAQMIGGENPSAAAIANARELVG